MCRSARPGRAADPLEGLPSAPSSSISPSASLFIFFFFQAEDGIRDKLVTGVQTCALPILGLPVQLKAIDAYIHELHGEPQNTPLRLGIAELLRLQKQYQQAVNLLDEGLARNAADQKMAESKLRICLEGELWRCVVDGFVQQLKNDSTRQADSSFLKSAIGAAQQISDTQDLLLFAHTATRHFPKHAPFWEALGAAFDLKGQRDSSVWAYKQAFAIDPNRYNTALLIAKTIVEGTVYDTAHAPPKSDSVILKAYRNAFADKLDNARAYVTKALASPDSNLRVSAAVILLQGGQKIAQTQAYDRAYPWLDQALQLVPPQIGRASCRERV